MPKKEATLEYINGLSNLLSVILLPSNFVLNTYPEEALKHVRSTLTIFYVNPLKDVVKVVKYTYMHI